MSGWNDPNQPPATDPRSRTVLTAAAVALTLIVLIALTTVVLTTRHRSAAPGSSEGAGTLQFSPANTAGPQPFTAPVVVASALPPTGAPVNNAGSAHQGPVSVERDVRLVSGIQPGLFATIGSELPCDAAAMANDLDSHPDAAHAWATALGLTPQQIPYYLNTLTPVILAADTWVTSHRLAGDKATPFQTVLQTGDAILVDPVGVPRVHCAGGRPLRPPDDTNITTLVAANGDPWPGYSPHTVVAVAYAAAKQVTPIHEFVLVDLNSGEAVTRKAGGTISLGPPPTGVGALPDPVAANMPPPPAGKEPPR